MWLELCGFYIGVTTALAHLTIIHSDMYEKLGIRTGPLSHCGQERRDLFVARGVSMKKENAHDPFNEHHTNC